MNDEQLLDLILGKSGLTLPDYVDGWVDDPEAEIEKQGGDWACVLPALRPLAMNLGGDVTAAEPSVMDLVTASTPWRHVDGDPSIVARGLYSSLARTAQGESIFRTGTDALLHLDYPRSLVQSIPRWVAQRFAGIGSVWESGAVTEPGRILDLGCGAGVDAHVARAVHPAASVIGIDRSMDLLTGAAGAASAEVSFLRGSASALASRGEVFDLVLANGLPPLLGTATMTATLHECARVLRPGGELRFTSLVVGGDRPVEELSVVWLFNALRIGKPVVPAVREALSSTGFVLKDLRVNPSPFVIGFRAAGVRSATFSAVRSPAP